MKQILLDAANIGIKEKEYLNKCIDSTFVSTAGPYVPEFEHKFAEYNNSKRAISTQSGTSAIHISLYELGVKEGDEIIVPAITFIASINPIVYLGATPVFVDIDPDTWNMLPEEVEKAITKNTKAIMPVHIYGNPCDMNSLIEISNKYGIPIIEDATESLGATYNGVKSGNLGKFGAFSFNGNKIMTTGGGGMVVTNDEHSANHIKFLVNQARDEAKGYYHPEIGFNYRMTNLEAALGLAQLERLDEFLNKKIEFARIYTENLSDIKSIKFQKEYKEAKSSWWLTSAKIYSELSIPEIQHKLKEFGIPSRRIFVPIVEFPPYQKFKKGEYKNSYELYDRGINLPSSTVNEINSVVYISDKLREILK